MLFPKGYYTLFCSEFAARFCFWAVQSILVLYLTKQFSMSDAAAYEAFAAYGALTYAATFFGGLLADKYFGALRMLIIGIAFSAIGMFLLLLDNQQVCYYGLGMLVVGMGLYMPANVALLDNLYEKNDPLRDRGYFYLYVATNIGGIFGPLCLGLISQYYSFRASFLCCGFLLIICLLTYYFNSKRIKFFHLDLDHEAKQKLAAKYTAGLLAMLFTTVFIVCYLIKTGKVGLNLLGSVGICALISFVYRGRLAIKSVKNSIFIALFFSFISIFFFAIEFQLLNSFITFTRDYVDKNFLVFSIPTASFVAFQPLFVVILAPVVNSILEKQKGKFSMTNMLKFSVSFLFLSLSFLILSTAAQHYHNTNHLINPFWLVLSTFFISAGEVFLMPVLLALVTKESPENMKNSMVGFLYLCLSLASYLSGEIANLVKSKNITVPVLGYQAVYWKVFVFSLGISVLLWLLNRTTSTVNRQLQGY